MPDLVAYILIFTGLGAFFLFIHLVMGKLIRPVQPEPEKLTIYECGEPTIGSAWIQFDLRYYVVALLFVIFDVEVAFFFPWATVFGKAHTLSQETLTEKQRVAISRRLLPEATGAIPALPDQPKGEAISPAAARHFALFGFFDILVFFGVLLVGFAYLWRRGDITWIRSTVSEEAAEPPPPPLKPTEEELLVHG